MKKAMSTMTSQQFVEITAALGIKYIELAAKLGRSHSTVSQYSTGKKAIPAEIAQQLDTLIQARAAYINQLKGNLEGTQLDVGQLIVETNAIRQAAELRPSNKYRLMRRLQLPDHRPYPPYRLGERKTPIFARALASWRDEVRLRLKALLDDADMLRMHRLELADVEVLIDHVPRTLPYDITITRTEWDVVARALRHSYNSNPIENASAYAIYQHWRAHKGTGYPYKRAPITQQQGEAA